MENIYIWENYVKNEGIFRNLCFTNKIISLLQSKISSGKILGAFYTHYGGPNPHIKIGLLVNNGFDELSLKQGVRDLIGSNNLLQQSDTKKEVLFCPVKIEKATEIIACFAFELLNIVRDKNNQEISEVYEKVFWNLADGLNISRGQILVNFGQFKQKHPDYFLSKFTLFTIENKKCSTRSNDLDELCKKIETWIKENVLDKEQIWFLCDRLFHHCNNSNNKFWDGPSGEYEIFQSFMKNIQRI